MSNETITSSNNALLDVLVVGAGQAGMAAAHRLLMSDEQLRIHVLEAHPHVGGRTLNLFPNDNAVELGGTWVSPDHTAFLDLCNKLDIELFPASFWNMTTTMSNNYDQDENTRQDFHPLRARGEDNIGSSEVKDENDDWPWWYWGAEYFENVTKSTIFHHEYDTNGTSDQNHKHHGAFLVQSPDDLRQNLDPKLWKELEDVGETIEHTIESSLKDLSWDAGFPGAHWSRADELTTSAALFPYLNTAGARNIVRNFIHDKNAQEPNQVSWLYNLISIKGCNSDGPDSELRVRGGSQAVPLAVARLLGSDRLTLGDPVQSVQVMTKKEETDGTGGRLIHVRTRSGELWPCRALILTGSPPAILNIQFDPPLPAVHAQLLQRMPMGTARKVIALYQRNGPWWRSYGLSGDILASALPKDLSVATGVDGGDRVPLFGQCFDTSPFSQKFGVLMCSVLGHQNIYFSTLSEEEQHKLTREFLRLTFMDVLSESKSEEHLWEPDAIHTHNWADDEYVRGAYTSFFPPGVLSVPEWWEAYRYMEKLPNVFLAGSDYQAGYGNGYMEGAVRSGQHAADLVKQRLEGAMAMGQTTQAG